MATSNDTCPIDLLDRMTHLNHRLEAFQLMHSAWLNSYLKDASDTRHEAVSGGVYQILEDILTGYQLITDRISDL